MKLSQKLIDYLSNGNGMFLGTRDANLLPEVHRVLGAKAVDENHIRFYFDTPTAGRTFDNINNNQFVSLVTCSDTFESYQFKGKSLGFREATEEENQEVATYLQKFHDLMLVFGLMTGFVYAYPHSKMSTILMEVEEVFEQTPKIGTGQKI